MAVLSSVLHEMALAFGCSTNLRTLPARLALGMSRHLPVAEVETLRLLEARGEVRISAFAPESERRWEGQRSCRYFEQQRVDGPTWTREELARVALTPIAVKLELPVGHTGLLAIAFETDISVGSRMCKDTEIWVDVLAAHCLRLGQLMAAASECRRACHRNSSVKQPVSQLAPSKNTDMPVNDHPSKSTDIPVETLDTALIRCISTALQHTGGKIYGDNGAAALLGLKPSTLQSKMRKLGIERSAFVA